MMLQTVRLTVLRRSMARAAPALQAERAALAWLLQSLQRGARDTRSGMEQARLVSPPPRSLLFFFNVRATSEL